MLSNCKYTEIVLIYPVDDSYAFLYFVQDNKSKDLSYLGLKKSNTKNDPSIINNDSAFNATEF